MCVLRYQLRVIDIEEQPGRPSTDILVISCQDLRKILAKILPRYCLELHARCHGKIYQNSHVSKKNLTKKSSMARKIFTKCLISSKSKNRKTLGQKL